MSTDFDYCNSLTKYSRTITKKVKIGNLYIGGGEPIRVQSMTTTNTLNTEETVKQSIRMIESGCELVRITAPSKKEVHRYMTHSVHFNHTQEYQYQWQFYS